MMLVLILFANIEQASLKIVVFRKIKVMLHDYCRFPFHSNLTYFISGHLNCLYFLPLGDVIRLYYHQII